VSNHERLAQFGVDDDFIRNKIGVDQVAIREEGQETSDLCVEAVRRLFASTGLQRETVDALVVVTQNPDRSMPHTSAIVHGKLDLAESCLCFDIALGCSGFVYGLAVLHSLMERLGRTHGLLVTADPYSKIVDRSDKNTSLLFGDAAAATLLTAQPRLALQRFTFGTVGKSCESLTCVDGRLCMNGRAIFEFAARYVPSDVSSLLEQEGLSTEDVDRFVFHQGSKYIVDTIRRRLRLDERKAPFRIQDYGNTVSSSIPIILEEELRNPESRRIVISGFGVGLSWSSALLERVDEVDEG
jgi:3-oxoacyl-[acyl-carrier-protein] synthase-3